MGGSRGPRYGERCGERGSFETLNALVQCGFSPLSRLTRWTNVSLQPIALASERVDHLPRQSAASPQSTLNFLGILIWS